MAVFVLLQRGIDPRGEDGGDEPPMKNTWREYLFASPPN